MITTTRNTLRYAMMGGLVSLGSACQAHSRAVSRVAPPIPEATEERLTDAELERTDLRDRDALVCAVLERNPDIGAAEEALAAARAGARRPTAAGGTRVSWSIAPASIGSDVRFGTVVEVEQSVRLGQRRLEREVASTAADALAHRRDGVRNELALQAADLYDAHYEVEKALQTNAEHHALVSELIQAARHRYASGLGPAQDPLQAELELARIDAERIELEAERTVVVAQTNRLLHRASDAALPDPAATLDRPEEIGDANELRARALASRPELREAATGVEASERSAALARRRFAPELSVMASYNSMWSDLEHRFMVGVGVVLPLQVAALRAGVAQARAEERRARRIAESERDRIAADVEAAVARVSATERVVALHRERLIPTARARVDAARRGYESNANDIDTLIDAERELRRVELDAHRTIAELDRRRAELDWAVGRTPCAEKEAAR